MRHVLPGSSIRREGPEARERIVRGFAPDAERSCKLRVDGSAFALSQFDERFRAAGGIRRDEDVARLRRAVREAGRHERVSQDLANEAKPTTVSNLLKTED